MRGKTDYEGHCLRYPPALMTGERQDRTFLWPQTMGSSWCGEFSDKRIPEWQRKGPSWTYTKP